MDEVQPINRRRRSIIAVIAVVVAVVAGWLTVDWVRESKARKWLLEALEQTVRIQVEAPATRNGREIRADLSAADFARAVELLSNATLPPISLGLEKREYEFWGRIAGCDDKNTPLWSGLFIGFPMQVALETSHSGQRVVLEAGTQELMAIATRAAASAAGNDECSRLAI